MSLREWFRVRSPAYYFVSFMLDLFIIVVLLRRAATVESLLVADCAELGVSTGIST